MCIQISTSHINFTKIHFGSFHSVSLRSMSCVFSFSLKLYILFFSLFWVRACRRFLVIIYLLVYIISHMLCAKCAYSRIFFIRMQASEQAHHIKNFVKYSLASDFSVSFFYLLFDGWRGWGYFFLFKRFIKSQYILCLCDTEWCSPPPSLSLSISPALFHTYIPLNV